jgi:hypothetical protein
MTHNQPQTRPTRVRLNPDTGKYEFRTRFGEIVPFTDKILARQAHSLDMHYFLEWRQEEKKRQEAEARLHELNTNIDKDDAIEEHYRANVITEDTPAWACRKADEVEI